MSARLRSALIPLAVTLALGVVTGLLEGLILWTEHWVFGRVIFTSRHLLWMTPLVYALVFGALGTVLAVGAWLAPRVVTVPVAVFLATSFGIGCLLLPVGQISRIAAAILAAGIGVQFARLAARRPARARRVLTRSLVGLCVAAGLAEAVGEVRVRTDSSGLAEVEPTRAPLPNVLIIVWDTVRSASLSLYGCGCSTTPTLDRLAGQSVVFDRAFSTSPWSLPGHATLFTGYFPHEVSASWYERLDDARPTLAEVFRSAGLATGGFVANMQYTAYDSGLARGFDVFRDYRLSRQQLLRSSAFTQTWSGGHLLRARSLRDAWEAIRAFNWSVPVKRSFDPKHSDELNEQFLEWVDGLQGKPFFGFLNYFDAHEYWSPPQFRQRFGKGAVGAYEAAIAYQDDRLGMLLDELSRRGILDNTLVVVTADHGELLGEHGLYGHAKALYFPVLHVPLLIRYPERAPEGRRVEEEVSLRDVPATILDLAGLRPSTAFPGTSLARTWSREAAPMPEPLLAEVEEGRNNPPEDPISRGPVRSVISGGWQYILNGDGAEELYDYERRPHDETNLVDLPDEAATRESLRAELAGFLPDVVRREAR